MVKPFVTQVVSAILESGQKLSAGQKKAERCPLLYEWHGKQYVGAAHGLAGIFYMLLQVRTSQSSGWGLMEMMYVGS